MLSIVLNWIKAMFGFPGRVWSDLVSGGSIANLIGLAVMRHIKESECAPTAFTVKLHRW
jgi:glutamate/tyrosine decarboxylase-like PLP-dependent enzyme